MGLQAHHAVADVGAHPLQGLRPLDVGRLVEARLDLHRNGDLLARLGGADQRLHVRRLGRGAVEGLLDGEHRRVVRRRLDEALDAGGEGVVGVMDQDVAGGDGAEDARASSSASEWEKRGWVTGVQGRKRSDGSGDRAGERHQVLQRQRPLDLVDLGLGDLQLLEQQLEHPARHPPGHLEPHDGGEAALAQLLLDHLQQVLGGLLVAVDVGVAGHPEGVGLDDLHAGEQPVEVVGDHLLERHEAQRLRHLHPARQDVRRLDPREARRRVARGP